MRLLLVAALVTLAAAVAPSFMEERATLQQKASRVPLRPDPPRPAPPRRAASPREGYA
jgi:hypothetical protein